MKTEILIGDKHIPIDLVSRHENKHVFSVNGKTIEVDVVRVSHGIYSFLYKGRSYQLEVSPSGEKKKYIIRYKNLEKEVQVMDAESRYALSRGKGVKTNGQNNISSPMPGKVVKILVEEGEQVTGGQTLIVISAMKMESEYKSGIDGHVKRILVREGDTIEGKQVLIELEPLA